MPQSSLSESGHQSTSASEEADLKGLAECIEAACKKYETGRKDKWIAIEKELKSAVSCNKYQLLTGVFALDVWTTKGYRKKKIEKIELILLYTAALCCEPSTEVDSKKTFKFLIDHKPSNLTEIPEGRFDSILNICVARKNLHGCRMVLKGLEKLGENKLTESLKGGNKVDLKRSGENGGAQTELLGTRLPLSIAAQNADRKMVDLLLKYGSSVEYTDRVTGDNVFHTLVKAATAEKKKRNQKGVKDMMEMFLYFTKGNEDLVKRKNERNFSPLMLALDQKCSEMFELIINLEGIYRSLVDLNSLGGVYKYDIQELNHIRERDPVKCTHTGAAGPLCPFKRSACQSCVENGFKSCVCTKCVKIPTLSKLIQQKNGLLSEESYVLAGTTPIKEIIKNKWKAYQHFHVFFTTCHVSFVIMLTVWSLFKLPSNDFFQGSYSERFTTISLGVICVIYVIVLEACEIIIMMKYRMRSCVGNVSYRVAVHLLCITTLLAFIFRFTYQPVEVYFLAPSCLLGYMIILFFVSGWKRFSYFTVVLQTVVRVDMFRFLVFYGLLLLSFTTAVFLSTQHHNIPQLTSFFSTMFFLYRNVVGMALFSELNDASVLTQVLFVMYSLASLILLLNMLVALLSSTTSDIANRKKEIWNLQKLSIVLYYEGILKYVTKRCSSNSSISRRFRLIDDDDFCVTLTSLNPNQELADFKKEALACIIRESRSFLTRSSKSKPTAETSPSALCCIPTKIAPEVES